MRKITSSRSVLSALIFVLLCSPLVSSVANISMMNLMNNNFASINATPVTPKQVMSEHCQKSKTAIAEQATKQSAAQQDRSDCCESPCQCDAMGCYTGFAISSTPGKLETLSTFSYQKEISPSYAGPLYSPSFPPPIS